MTDTRWATKEEKKTVKEFGGRPVSNSGAGWHSKGDGVIPGLWRQDVKSTKKDAYKVTGSVLNKLEKDANLHGCKPMLIVNFVKERMKVVLVPEYCLPEEDFDFPDDKDNEVCPYSHGYKIMVRGNPVRYIVLTGEVAKTKLGLAPE